MCFTLAVGTGILLIDCKIFVEVNVLFGDSYELRYVVFEDSNVSVEYNGYDENMCAPLVCNDDVSFETSEKDNKINYDEGHYTFIISLQY